jgi:hypothetical protein
MVDHYKPYIQQTNLIKKNTHTLSAHLINLTNVINFITAIKKYSITIRSIILCNEATGCCGGIQKESNSCIGVDYLLF